MSYQNFIKPFIDKSVSLILIIGLFPFWLFGILLIVLVQGTPLLFCQLRTGYKMKRFTIYKIRTLNPSENSDLSIKGRTFTSLGRFLRFSSLDEFPQLFNVLKGDMSLIGPRPMPIEYERKYSEYQKMRFSIKPGITGWAQVNGRNSIQWEDRFKMDYWYVKNISFRLDMKIIGLTLLHLFENQAAEMPIFTGSNND